MLSDATTFADLRLEWDGVEQMQKRMQTLCVVTFASGGITAHGLAKVVYNMPLLLAFSVLGETLLAIRREGHFTGKRDHVGPLMDDAKTSLTWLDWQSLRDGVKRRNQVAHDGVLFESKQCLEDIDLVRKQLAAWTVI